MENTENKDAQVTESTETKTPEVEVKDDANVKALADKDKEIANLKRLLSNANSEAADWKRQFRAHQSEEERKAAEIEEQRKAEQTELAQLRKEKQIASYANDFMGLGMDKDTAIVTAQAKADGDDKSVFAALKALTENITKNATTKALDSQAGLSVGSTPKGAKTQEDEVIAEIAKRAGVVI